ncbi:MAG: hypothetical protein NTX03_07335 [Bacteroidetes bacterium]|nr:hypothetical protein [Bacteroidota bacterium]
MLLPDHSFLTDAKGKTIGVFLSIKQYQKMLKELEDLDDIRLYDEGKKDKAPSVPIDEAFKIVESMRRKAK